MFHGLGFYKCYIIFVLYSVYPSLSDIRSDIADLYQNFCLVLNKFWTLTGLYSIKFIIARTTIRVSIEFYSGPHWWCLFYVSYRPKPFWTRLYWQNPYGNFRTDMLYLLFVKDNILNTFAPPPQPPHTHTFQRRCYVSALRLTSMHILMCFCLVWHYMNTIFCRRNNTASGRSNSLRGQSRGI